MASIKIIDKIKTLVEVLKVLPVSISQSEIVDQINSSETKEQFRECFRSIAEATGFDFFLFALALPNTVNDVDVIIYDNYPDKWRAAYDQNGYSKKDPIVRYSISELLPIKWSDVTVENGFSAEEVGFMKLAGNFGLGEGFSFPTHAPNGGFGMISLAMEPGAAMEDDQYQETLELLQKLIPTILNVARRIQKEKVSGFKDLTAREKEALVWTAEGKSSWEIAQILGISERTVNFHISQASMKLNANNRVQAVSTASTQRYSEPLLAPRIHSILITSEKRCL